MTALSDADRWAIVDLRARYCIGLDADDAEAVAGLFLPDAPFETYGTAYVGPDGIRKMLRHAPKGLHLGGLATVEPAGFGAVGTQQLMFVDASDHSTRLAVYDDEMVPGTGGRWLFRRRVCRFVQPDGTLGAKP